MKTTSFETAAVNKRKFGVKHPFAFFPNAGVFTKKFSDEAAAKADQAATQIFTGLAVLTQLFGQGSVDGLSVSLPLGVKLFYEVG